MSASAVALSTAPVRTCIGCRRRAAATDLLRVVAAHGASGRPARAVPDVRRRIPGRGAWVHPEPGCVALAERRRAFARALRVPDGLDPSPVVEYVAESRPPSGPTAGDDRPMDAR